MTIRVLQVVTSMNRGGLEVWLMHVLRNIDRERYRFDFLVQSQHQGLFDEEIRSLGSRVIATPRGNNPLAFARAYVHALRTYGPYDVVHTHLHHFSGIVALLSRLAGVPAVVAHSHNATYGDRRKLGFAKRTYLRFTEWLMRRFVAVGVGCSEMAGQDLFQNAWQDRARHRVLYCGLDFSRFGGSSAQPPLPGVAPAARTIVHVGRFTTQKNHDFLIDTVAALEKRRSDYRVLLVGTGALEDSIRAKVARLGLSQRVFFLGDRDDVAALLRISDLFLFPSLNEGLPLALLEAQAAGLRCLLSDVITTEVSVLPGATSTLPLQAGAERWAQTLDELLSAPPLDRRGALDFMQSSNFSVAASIRELATLYAGLVDARS